MNIDQRIEKIAQKWCRSTICNENHEYCILKIELRKFVSDIMMEINLAITDKGVNPSYHDEVMTRHRKEWPTLWKAIDNALRTGIDIKEKYNV